jgi:hypothetical protein
MKLKLTLLLFILSSGLSAYAQSKGKEYDAIVYSINNTRYKGFVQNVSESGITIDYFGRNKFIPADSINKIRIKHVKALRKHALIASVGGLVAGYFIYEPQHNSGKVSVLALPIYMVGSAVVAGIIGAGVNSFTAVKTYKNVQAPGNFKIIQPELIKFSGDYNGRRLAQSSEVGRK